MNNDHHANYGRIGFTIVIGVAAIVGTLIYLGGLRGRADELLLETYYDQPVPGLSVGSVVNFRGVKVGEVREIGFVGSHYDAQMRDSPRIYILMALKRNLLEPVGTPRMSESGMRKLWQNLVEKMGLRATVVSNGITGLARIEMDFNLENPPPIPQISWTPSYAYIPAKMSLLDNFSVAATKVMNQINKMDIATAWSNLTITVDSLARTSESLRTIVDERQSDFDQIMNNLNEASASAKAFMRRVEQNPTLLLRESVREPLEETE